MTIYPQASKYWLLTVSLATSLTLAGCHSSTAPAPIISSTDAANTTPNNQDPALANVADTGNGTQVLGQSASYAPQQQAESYAPAQQAAAPVEQNYADQNTTSQNYDYQNPPDSGDSQAVYADQAPPPLPEYDQPPAPDPNYLWTPGYWAYGSGGYYWVPGAWAQAPYYGALWTPPYWGYYGHRYRYYHGYWGPHVGYYGGVNYGFGFIGVGFFGGYWHGHDFYYNRDVTRINNVRITNVYNRTVIYNNVHYGMQPNNRVSYNGGNGGITSRPQPFEIAAMRERHEGPTAVQQENHAAAMNNRQQFYADNHGRPAMAVATRPLATAGGIRPTPSGIQTGRPGFNGRPAETTQPARPEPGRPQPANNEMTRPGGQPQPGNQFGRPEQGRPQPGTMQENRLTPQPMQQQQGHPATPAPMTQRPTTGLNNPGMRPAPTRPTPEARPTPQQQVRPQPQQEHPQPQQVRQQPQQSRPQPQPQPAQHQAPAVRPQPEARPQPAARPAPEARPQPAPRPAPAQHAAPAPAQHAAPAPHEEGGHPGGEHK